MKNLLIFLFLTSSIAIAQNPQLIVYNSPGLGLPGNRISEIAIDKNLIS